MQLTQDQLDACLPFREPHALFVNDDDRLRVSVWGTGTNVVVVSGRFLTLNGDVVPFDFRVTAPASRVTPTTKVFTLGQGWLLNATAISLTATGGLAWTYVACDLVRGDNAQGGVSATLMQGTVSSMIRRAWPGSVFQTPFDSPGIIRSITGTDPSAGVEISETVPTGARWRLLSFFATLVTSGVAATRQPYLVIDDGTNILFALGTNTTQLASLTGQWMWAAGMGNWGAPGGANATDLPYPFELLAGYRIRTVTISKDAGDNWGAPQYAVEEWLEGA